MCLVSGAHYTCQSLCIMLCTTISTHEPVKNGRSSERVLSSPRARAIVESFLIEFRRNYSGIIHFMLTVHKT